MGEPATSRGLAPLLPPALVALLRCPISRKPLAQAGDMLVAADGAHRYRITADGIPLFAGELSAEARTQQAHYDTIAAAYVANLAYPHTEEYLAYLDRALLAVMGEGSLGTVAEICCGRGEAFALLSDRVERGVGVDISLSMLKAAVRHHGSGGRLAFAQGDATSLPLADASFDAVVMLGGIHHVTDRRALFTQIERILKPGGRFYFREPVSDFAVWRALRALIYRLSPILDHDTERPLLYRETVPVLAETGLDCRVWRTFGFLGFCFFMNSDVLVFNRLFRFLPGIRALTRLAARLDDWALRLPGMSRAGLQVVGVAVKSGG